MWFFIYCPPCLHTGVYPCNYTGIVWLSLSEYLWVFPEVYLLLFEFQFQISDVVMEDLNIVWTHLKFTWHICDHLETNEFHLGNLNINYKCLKFVCPNWILSKNIWISSQNVWKRPGKGVVINLRGVSTKNIIITLKHIFFYTVLVLIATDLSCIFRNVPGQV
jgi:hypothetical protein